MEDGPKAKGQSSEEIAKFWDDYSSKYSQLMTYNFEGVGLHMFNLVEGRKADTILETGCGDGTVAFNYCLSKKKGAKLILSDISPAMCKIAASRFEKLSQRASKGDLLGCKDILDENPEDTEVTWVANEGKKWDNLGVELYEADNENLKAMVPQGSSVDCLIANLSLHLVTNPKLMLAEAVRVLRPGKMAVFSVWGNQAQSTYFNLMLETEAKFGKTGKPSPMVNNFYLNDRNRTIRLMEEAGFVDVLCWEEMVAFIPGDTELESYWEKQSIAGFCQEGSEQYKQALEYYEAAKHDLLKVQKSPIGLSLLIVRGTKPN